jgi:hypothetical protein
MWEIVIIAVLVLIAAVLILAALRPDSFRVQRATSIGAPPDRIFALMGKLMGLVLNMDRMIGKDFEAGLANLKTITEK